MRLLSREIFVKIDANHNIHRLSSRLLELRDIFFFYNPSFTTRFLNQEMRNRIIWEDGSELRKLATVKELFATHMCLLWMALKERNHAFPHGQDAIDGEKVARIIKDVKSLVSCDAFLELVSDVSNYPKSDLNKVLNTFERDKDIQSDA